jgi:hypothetical protein
MLTAPLPAAPMARPADLLGAAGVLLAGVMALTQPLPPKPAAAGPAVPGHACALYPDGFLRGRFFGALDLAADWAGAELTCDGMQRPDGQGVRLFFAGAPPGGGRISVLIGLDGRPQDLKGGERLANLTIIDERDGRFFSTAGQERCWASINAVAPVVSAGGRTAGSRIEGVAYCVGALPAVADHASLTVGDLHFAGWVAADAK